MGVIGQDLFTGSGGEARRRSDWTPDRSGCQRRSRSVVWPRLRWQKAHTLSTAAPLAHDCGHGHGQKSEQHAEPPHRPRVGGRIDSANAAAWPEVSGTGAVGPAAQAAEPLVRSTWPNRTRQGPSVFSREAARTCKTRYEQEEWRLKWVSFRLLVAFLLLVGVFLQKIAASPGGTP